MLHKLTIQLFGEAKSVLLNKLLNILSAVSNLTLSGSLRIFPIQIEKL